LDRERSCGRIQDRVGPERDGERVSYVAYVEPAEYGDAQRAQLILEYVDEGPPPVLVALESGATPQDHTRDPVEGTGAPQLGEFPIHLPEPTSALVFEQHDGSLQVREASANEPGDRPEVAT
jgi:hypothetical protein